MPLNTYIEVAVAAGTEHAVHEVAAHEVRNGTRGDALLTCAWGKRARTHAHTPTHTVMTEWGAQHCHSAHFLQQHSLDQHNDSQLHTQDHWSADGSK